MCYQDINNKLILTQSKISKDTRNIPCVCTWTFCWVFTFNCYQRTTFFNNWWLCVLPIHSTSMPTSLINLLTVFFYRVAFVFGAITMVSGIVGVPLGTVLAQSLKKRYPRADPIICAFGLLISAPFLLGAMLVVPVSAPAAYALVFFGSVALNLNWAIVADILLVRSIARFPKLHTSFFSYIAPYGKWFFKYSFPIAISYIFWHFLQLISFISNP